MRGEAFNLRKQVAFAIAFNRGRKFPSVDGPEIRFPNPMPVHGSILMIEFANSLVVYDHENNTRLSIA